MENKAVHTNWGVSTLPRYGKNAKQYLTLFPMVTTAIYTLTVAIFGWEFDFFKCTVTLTSIGTANAKQPPAVAIDAKGGWVSVGRQHRLAAIYHICRHNHISWPLYIPDIASTVSAHQVQEEQSREDPWHICGVIR